MEADPESSDPGDPSRRMDIGIVPALPIKHKSYLINIFDLFQFSSLKGIALTIDALLPFEECKELLFAC